MPYDREFYKQYVAYLEEPIVRENHAHMFDHFASLFGAESLLVADLGCGTGEYERHGAHRAYIGIDQNHSGFVKNFLQGNWRMPGFLNDLPFQPNALVSIFSIELMMRAEERYKLYERLFFELPSVRLMLASGFFYESKRSEEIVGEAGGIMSYQTIEDPALFLSPIFTEFRCHIATPSQMFGPDVIEVWKILSRR